MVDPRLYEQDAFVFLEAGKPEELVSVDELKERLAQLLTAYADEVPTDVTDSGSIEQQVQYLIDAYCELSIGDHQYFQWFAVRLEKD